MDFWFLFKKNLSIYVHPLTMAMELIFLGVVLVGFSRRRRKRGKEPGKFARWLKRASGNFGAAFVIGGLLFLYLTSINPVAARLVYALEKKYPPLRLDQMTEQERAAIEPDFIVVLAGGERFDPEKPATSQLSHVALARVSEGVRLALLFPRATVVFTGQPREIRAMTESLLALGISPDRVVSESKSRDTKDHPRYLRAIIGDDRLLLVTSGTHMPRAMALFTAEGFTPVAASCDLWVWPRSSAEYRYELKSFIPKVENLSMTSTAFHEYFGIAWVKLREAEEQRAAVEESPIRGQERDSPVGKEEDAPEPGSEPESAPLPLPDLEKAAPTPTKPPTAKPGSARKDGSVFSDLPQGTAILGLLLPGFIV